MLFTPQRYALADRAGEPFIDDGEIRRSLLRAKEPTIPELERIIARSLALERLPMDDVASLIAAHSPEAVARILDAAETLKQRVYGNRIVLFAPLYIGNRCINNCAYCGFRASNRNARRRTLSGPEIVAETEALEKAGHKRLILVYGEHPDYGARYIADTVRLVCGVRSGNGEIRRVNVNAAPLDAEGFRIVREAGIGTYQIFQETYDPALYRRFHPSGPKSDYDYRLTAFDRAMEAGIDDVGLGVLLGLGDWRYELLALIRHTNHLEACFGVGPHTISFPRIQEASSIDRAQLSGPGDDDFERLIAILRLAVPYTGLILTAREPAALRDRLIRRGVSQIDAGSRLEIGGYSEAAAGQDLDREQFRLSDERPLGEAIASLVARGQVPSFCTACYRKGRTGEHFMEFSTRGFIKRFCTPNALLTFAEYLEDYAAPELREQGWRLIRREAEVSEDCAALNERLRRIRDGERDLLF